MNTTEWTITRGFIKLQDCKLEGVSGPKAGRLTPEHIQQHPNSVRFRLFDDDKELYCEGYMLGKENEFAPLDDFGAPSLGCTEIHLADTSGRFTQL